MNAPNFEQFAAGVPTNAQPHALPPPTVTQAPAKTVGVWPPQNHMPPAVPVNPYAPQHAPVPMSQATPQGNAFGKGAFAGAAPMSERKDCLPGMYVFECVKTEQAKERQNGGTIWRMTWKVIHLYEGTQPLGSEVTDAEFMNDDRQRQYAASTMLSVTTAAMGCQSHEQLKAGLDGCLPPDQVSAMRAAGNMAPGWSEFADALQSPTTTMSQHFPPNPLAGKKVLGRVTLEAPVNKPGTKHHGRQFTRFEYAIAPVTP